MTYHRQHDGLRPETKRHHNPYTTPGLPAAPAWHDNAACTDQPTELFFPERGSNARPAKAICQHCPVKAECLDYALTVDDGLLIGVWGGTTETERRALRRQRKATQ